MDRLQFFISIMIALGLVTLSPLLDENIVTKKYDLSHHRLGYPLPIIDQHTSLTPLEDALPFTLGFVNPLENPTELII